MEDVSSTHTHTNIHTYTYTLCLTSGLYVQDAVPPLACKFNMDGLHGNLLAVADEEGVVGLYDTRKKLSESQLAGVWG